MKHYFTSFLLLLVISITPSLRSIKPTVHPFHASICEIDHNTKEHTIEIALKLFADDLENNLNKKVNRSLKLLTPQQDPEAANIILAYLWDHFSISINNESRSLIFVGIEPEQTENYTFWVYLQIPNIDNMKSINIFNNILTDTYADQTNIVHVKANKQKKSFMFSLNQPSWICTFD